MGGLSIWHILILLIVVAVVPAIVLVVAVRPTGPNRFGPPSEPVSFAGAVATCLRKYADFNGRARRSEYWWFYLAFWLIIAAIGFVARVTEMQIINLVSLALMIPLLAAGARRLHDSNRSALWLLLGFTGIGGIALIVLLAQPSQGDEAAKVF